MEETVEARTTPDPSINKNEQAAEISPYEQTRKERIKANLERMEKLGIVDLSLKLKSLTTPKRTRKTTPPSQKPPSSPLPSGPLRRSSRLNNATPVSYSEAALSKKDMLLERLDVMVEEGSKPEVYTEEHEKLLGKTERSWTLFVDGYGSNGKRIYDPIKGKTCHQCRQKTLGHRTHCSRCQIVQGQFCGDCLYMRYGENVLEALENSNWICPVCRGICNCSLCRQAKGWAPTGPLYRKISSLGYKSVAHYLIQTRRLESTLVEKLPTVNQVSAKRWLPFSDMETPSKRSNHQIKDSEPLMLQSEDMMREKTMEKNQLSDSKDPAVDCQTKRCLTFLDKEVHSENSESVEVKAKCEVHELLLGLSGPLSGGQIECCGNPSADCQTMTSMPISGSEGHSETLELKSETDGNLATGDPMERSMPISESEEQSEIMEAAGITTEVHDFGSVNPIMKDKKESDGYKDEEEKHLQSTNDERDNINVVTCQIHEDKRALASESSSDSIATSLRPWNQETNDHVGTELTCINEKTSDVKQSHSPNQQMQKSRELHVKKGNQNGDGTVVSEMSPVLQKKCRSTGEQNPDSIGGRLRQRRSASENEAPGANNPNSETLQALKNNTTMKEARANKKQTNLARPSEDSSIAKRLRSRKKLT